MRGRPYIGGLTRSPVGEGGRQPPLSPARGATGPPGAYRLGPLVGRPRGGRQAPSFFFSSDFVANLKEKKLHLSSVAPHRATGVYF